MKLKFTWYLILLLGAWSSNYSQENPRTYYFQKLINTPETNLLFQIDESNLFNSLSGFIPRSNLLHNDKHLKIDSIMTRGVPDGRMKTIFNYNNSSRINSYLMSHFFNNQWENSTQVTCEFDSSSNRIYALRESWSGTNWTNDFCEHFYYDSLGNNSLHLMKIWTNNSWINLRNVSNIFDTTGNIIESTTYEWVNNQWFNKFRITWEYFPNRKFSFINVYHWQNNNWTEKIRSTFKYNLEWILLSIIAEEWNGSNWNNSVQIIYTYNEQPPQTIEVTEVWDNDQWITTERISYSYNNLGYLIRGCYEYFVNSIWMPGNGPIVIRNLDGLNLGFITNELFVFYDTPTNIKENRISPPNFKLSQNYPNPFNPTTKIKYTIHSNVISTGGRNLGDFSSSSTPQNDKVNVQLKVYDILGNEIAALVNEAKVPGTYEVDFDGSNLPSGVYFYRIHVYTPGRKGNFTAGKKMILLK